ncbi:hypothetical protein GGE12_001756 [Rhizobium mongolense]|uniref:Uncharacterized protein n=1 Tax=Rhizobium mongolense TaxID=57676 RepID=A0A7W6RK79_9HYPH|nr:hypothetical protein [Rhizobium mongolense]
MMSKAPQVSCFRQDGQSVDRADTGDCAQELVVWIVLQHLNGPRFDLIALSDQTSALSQDHTEHAYGVCRSPLQCGLGKTTVEMPGYDHLLRLMRATQMDKALCDHGTATMTTSALAASKMVSAK